MSHNVIICSLYRGHHTLHDHASFCKGQATHTNLDCNSPLLCINCVGAKLPRKGHIAWDTSCPLRKKFHQESNCTGDSSDEELDHPMVVDPPVPPTNIPSSQPTDDKQVIFQPTCVDDLPPQECIPPPHIASYIADMKCFESITDPTYFQSLPIKELYILSEYGIAKAFSLGIESIPDLIQTLSNV